VVEGTPEDLINSYGGGNTLIIRGCKDTTQKLLLERFPEGQLEKDDILISILGNDGFTKIAKAVEVIRETGSPCKELYVHKATLEDVFLKLTGEEFVTEEAR
jgi:ABC-2 type transport system ATP-binding protein